MLMNTLIAYSHTQKNEEHTSFSTFHIGKHAGFHLVGVTLARFHECDAQPVSQKFQQERYGANLSEILCGWIVIFPSTKPSAMR